MLIGEHVNVSSVYNVMFKEDFTMDLAPGETKAWRGKAFRHIYDDHGSDGVSFGFKYEGYFLVLKDKQGRTQIIVAGNNAWESNVSQLLRAEVEKTYTRDFSREVPNPD